MKPVSGKEFSRRLEHHGWMLKRVHGSHHIYEREGSVALLSVPVHDNQALSPDLERHLLKYAGLTDRDF